MNKTNSIHTFLSACMIGFLLINAGSLAQERPNVLFISLDDMNDWLGCYGGHPDAKTPNIDRLAERGVLFSNAHCVSPICGPSRASVLTGMRPETTGVYHNKGKYIDYVPDAVTFPEHFRANGYVAMAAGKVNHDLGEPDPRLWNENGPDCGVLGTPFVGDELHTVKMTPERIINRGLLKITLPANGGLSAIDRPNNTWDSFDWAPLDCPETDFPDRKIADWSAGQLSKKHNKPFLMAVGFYKPHQPFFAPRKYFDLYDPTKVALPRTIAGDLHDIPAAGRELATQPWTSGTHQTVAKHGAWREAVHGYLATVSFADSLVGRVVDALDKSTYAENTWIVLWSDHGWSLGEKEHWGKHVPWNESVRMPLMIIPPRNSKLDGFEPGSRCDARVSLLDLYPTLIDACGLPHRKELEGNSLLPLITDPDANWNDAVVSTIGRGTHSISTDNWRYIHYFDGSEELYDLKNDPNEWFNIADQKEQASVKKQLAKHIPTDNRFKQFVRWGRWKCVIPVNGEPMLFDYQGQFGISEQFDLAKDRPDIVKQILKTISAKKLIQRSVDITSLVSAPRKLKIVAFGDSTTAVRSTINHVYADRLPGLLVARGIEANVINAGVSGSHTGRLSDNSRHRRKHALDRLDDAVRGQKPDIVIVQFGWNDSWIDAGQSDGPSRIPVKKYSANLEQIVATIRKDGAQVILMTPNRPHTSLASWQTERTMRYVEAVRALASKRSVPIIDVWAEYEKLERAEEESSNRLLLDNLHPNDKGHEFVASLACKEIARLVSQNK